MSEKVKNIKICYIGGGSKQWARVFMSDLALTQGLGGEIALYDIDIVASQRNAKIGGYINDNSKTLSKFEYIVYDNLERALQGADFVIISILPGTFKEMRSDVHAPEEYGIYQSVGDTVGPGGVLRAMRTVPLYEGFARAIKKVCPSAWVINYTNPMTICTKTLYDVFPQIKAFGCCHEVFHAQEFLTCVIKEVLGEKVTRKDIYTDACGINHFTWITEANYKGTDIFSLLPEFIDRFYEEGYFERGESRFAFKTDPFAYGNKVKMDLFLKHGALGGAGDRHLVEFLPNSWYLKDPQTVKYWQFGLTTVDYREKQQEQRVLETIEMAEGRKPFVLKKSDEEGVLLMKAIMGLGDVISNVNMPNLGQMQGLPLGTVVETNCVFSHNSVKPILSKPLPDSALNLVYRNALNIELTYQGIKERNLEKIYQSFINQPLLGSLTFNDSKALFKKMCYNTLDYLLPFYHIDEYFKND